METLHRAPADPAPAVRGLPLPARRSSLPSGRAVVGGLLIALAVLGTFVAYRGATGGPGDHYVVARQFLAPGATLTTDDLAVVEGELPDVVAAQVFSDPGALVDRQLKVAMSPGELVQAGALVPEGEHDQLWQVSVAVDPSRAFGGLLRVGETVQVLVTVGEGAAAVTSAVVSQAVVARVDNSDGVLASDGTVVTLDVDSDTEVRALANARSKGQVTLVRPPAAPEGPDTAGIVPDPGAATTLPTTPTTVAPPTSTAPPTTTTPPTKGTAPRTTPPPKPDDTPSRS